MAGVDQRGLIDLGYSGPCFIWNHGLITQMGRSVRLDRGLGNEDWRGMIQSAAIQHLVHVHSDHCLCCLGWNQRMENNLDKDPSCF